MYPFTALCASRRVGIAGVDMLPSPLPPDLFTSLPPAVQAYIRALEAVAADVAVLTARVSDLEARLAQTSANSSKPPSSDGPHV